MGFNKRYLTKENILSNLNYSYIFNIYKTDTLITDEWSDNFLCSFNKDKEYENIRLDILEKYKFDSNLLNIENDSNINKLENLSNILINLETNPTWLDILLTRNILKIEINSNGYFNEAVNICKESIKNSFEDE